MAIELANLMGMLSSGKLDGNQLSADTEVSPGLFWGELMAQLQQYDTELELENLDPSELAQQLSGFLAQTQLLDGTGPGQAEWFSSGERFLQQLKGLAGSGLAGQDSSQLSLADILAEQGADGDYADMMTRLATTADSDSLSDEDIGRSVQSLFANDSSPSEPENLLADPRLAGITRSMQAAASASGSGFPLPPLDKQIGQPEWQQGLGDRIRWMTNAQISSAELKLNPANLGPLEIRVQMENDQASITFSSQHASVREAVEAALPRLRDMLSSEQLSLGSIEVNQHQSQTAGEKQDPPDGHTAGFSSANSASLDTDAERAGSTGTTILQSDALVSYYV